MDMFAFFKKKKVSGCFLSTKINLCHQRVLTILNSYSRYSVVCSYPVVELRVITRASSERLNKLATNENFSTALPTLSFMCF